MKNLISKLIKKNSSWFGNLKALSVFSVILVLSLVACEKDETLNLKNDTASEPALKSAGKAKLPHQGNMVVVETDHMDFHLPDEIQSGWITFRYKNHDHHTYFFLVEKMPVINGDQKELDELGGYPWT